MRLMRVSPVGKVMRGSVLRSRSSNTMLELPVQLAGRLSQGTMVLQVALFLKSASDCCVIKSASFSYMLKWTFCGPRRSTRSSTALPHGPDVSSPFSSYMAAAMNIFSLFGFARPGDTLRSDRWRSSL